MNVVITGSSKGIGLGLAREFAARGHRVTVSSRRPEAVAAAVDELQGDAPGQVAGCSADVGNIADVQRLWEAATTAFGEVDIWINNAGMTNRRLNFADLPVEQITAVVNTNVLGLMNGCNVAIGGMLAQGHGRIFNMEGFGSDGLVQAGMTVYGTTKYAVRYFTKALVREYRNSPLVIGTMSPGIVVTDLLTRDLYAEGSPEIQRRRRFLNILADRVETVAPVLAAGALAASTTGADIRWMGPLQALGRLITSPFVKRDPFA